MRALSIAATGMTAQQLNVEVIANNMANINTTSFKRSRAEFVDLLYQNERAAGTPAAGGSEVIPEGVRIGLGVRSAAIRNLHQQGALSQTGNTLDLALMGRGFFRVTGADGETLYTRAAAFNKNATGQIVTADGHVVQPTIVVPQDVTTISVSDTGLVTGEVSGQVAPRQLGQLTVASFANEVGLNPLGGNLYRETSASGAAVVGTPGENGLGSIKQGYLETSNVDPVKEMTELISAQRAYEMNSKVIQASDEMMGIVAKGNALVLRIPRWISLVLVLLAMTPHRAFSAGGNAMAVPVPALTLRPGELISNDNVADRQLVVSDAAARSFAISRDQVVGKVAKRALAAGVAIPLNALREPWLFKDGERISIVFGQSGLSMRGAGMAMQPGVAGETISVRNVDTGVVIRGVVQIDGTVHVGANE